MTTAAGAALSQMPRRRRRALFSNESAAVKCGPIDRDPAALPVNGRDICSLSWRMARMSVSQERRLPQAIP
jgi:hypothetical protein